MARLDFLFLMHSPPDLPDTSMEGPMREAVRGLFSRRGLAAWIVLGISLLFTIAVWRTLLQRETDAATRQFNLMAGEIVIDIKERLRQHEQILLGGAGLFDASMSVSRNEWRAYISRLNLSKNYPGIQGVGFSEWIASGGLARHEARIRAEGFPAYAVRPPGEREAYTAIIYLEPFVERNLAAFGYDMFSEAVRNKAMRAAATTGQTSISGKVKLVQETHGKPQAGFLMYVPVYRGVPATEEERWRDLLGFVYSPYRVNDLMRGILSQRNVDLLDFTIHDGNADTDEALMYSSADEHLPDRSNRQRQSVSERIEAYGHAWSVRLHSRSSFDARFQSPLTWLVLPLGGAFGLALFALTWSLTSRREQAMALAQRMTARSRENEQRLRESNERLKLATGFSGIGVWEYHPDSGDLIWDEQMFVVYHVAPQEFSANYDAWYSRLHRDDRARLEAELAEALAGQGRFDSSFRIVLPDGEVRHIKGDGYLAQSADGAAPRMIGVNYDITEQKRTEEALAESARQNQAIFDNVVDGIITINSAGLVASFNLAAERIFAYRPEEVLGRNVNMLMPEPYHSQHDGYLDNYRATRIPRVIGIGREVVGRRKDGSVFPLDLAVSEIQHRGQPLFIGIVRDITERKKAERMKSEFVSTVSHELRTPLTSIAGSLGLLAGGALGSLPATALPMLEIATRNCDRLSRLIDDLLDMEKIEAGKLHFDLGVQPLMPLVEHALQANQGYAAQHKVTLRLSTRLDDVWVKVDAARLGQILSNFLSNAAKFSPPGEVVEITVQRSGGSVRIEVRDRGPGIPDDFKARIFEKFSQADSSDTRQKGGTGLGLAITRELAARMEGKVGYESQAGAGAMFYVELPVQDSPDSGPKG